MRRFYKHIAILFLAVAICNLAYAGNEQRAGQAGAGELLINPWAKSAGWKSANIATVKGVESMFVNIAGLSRINNTNISFCHTKYLVGADINLNSIGIAQKLKSGAFGLSITSMSFGDIEIITEEMPEGGLGYFKPQNLVFSLGYSHNFSDNISGGLNLKALSEGFSNMKANGVAIDAGIQYITTEEKLRFGITLKNIGPPMKYSGDGLSFRGSETNKDYEMTTQYRSQEFELPSLIQMGATYNFNLAHERRFSTAFMFTSNSFTNDQYTLGLEYSIREQFMLRTAYAMEKNIFNKNKRQNIFTGPSFGISYQINLKKEKKSKLNANYSYQLTNPFSGVHSIGLSINL